MSVVRGSMVRGGGRSRVMVRSILAVMMLGVSPLALAASAHAQAVARIEPGPGDPRIKQVMYDPDAIVQIRGQLGYEIPVEFDPNERVETVSIGDSLAWQVTPNRKATMVF